MRRFAGDAPDRSRAAACGPRGRPLYGLGWTEVAAGDGEARIVALGKVPGVAERHADLAALQAAVEAGAAWPDAWPSLRRRLGRAGALALPAPRTPPPRGRVHDALALVREWLAMEAAIPLIVVAADADPATAAPAA